MQNPTKILKVLSPLLIIFLGFLIYSNTLSSSFQFDDDAYILRNEAIKDLGNIYGIWNFFPNHTRFIALYSFAFNYFLSQYDPVSYHIINIFIHCCNSFFVFWLLMLLFDASGWTDKWGKDDRFMASAFAALIFIAHPIQTQAVAYIVQRFASLATFFYLFSVCCYLKGRMTASRRAGIIFFTLSLLSGVLGMFTKEIVFTLPLMILLAEKMFFLKDRIRTRYIIFILTFLLIIPFLFGFNLDKVLLKKIESGSHQGDIITWKSYALTQPRVILRYLQLIFMPVDQNLDYDFALVKNIFSAEYLFSLAVLLGLIGLAFFYMKKDKIVSFGIFWMFIALLVESSIIPIHHVIFEHRMYLPMVGVSISLSVLIWTAAKDKKSGLVYMFIIIAVISVLTFQRNKVWKSNITMWKDVIKKSPKKVRPYYNLANAYFERKMYEKALIYYDKTISMNPWFDRPHINVGIIFYENNMLDKALDAFDMAGKISPNNADVYANKGVVYKKKGRFDLAVYYLNKALELKPDNVSYYVSRGIAYKNMDKYDLAMKDYNKALILDPQNARATRSKAMLLWNIGLFNDSLRLINRAMELDPNNPIDYYNRSLIFASLGLKDKASFDAIKARELGLIY